MTNIEIPTYWSIVANEVFGRKAEPAHHPMIGEVAATQVTRLTRFRVPTQEEVIDFIRTSAKGIDVHSLGKDEPSEEDLKTTYFLKSLPASEVKEIARGNKNILKHLKNHYPESNLLEGRVYLKTFNGIVPNPALDSARKLMKKEGGVIYERTIKLTGVKEWNLRIRLLENGKFPDSLELEYLLDKVVRDSDVFSARGDFGSYQTVANQIRLLYNTLKSPELITQIRDDSYQFLEQQAASTVKETVQCIVAKNVIGELEEIITQTVEEFSKRKEPPKNPFGYPGDPSSN